MAAPGSLLGCQDLERFTNRGDHSRTPREPLKVKTLTILTLAQDTKDTKPVV